MGDEDDDDVRIDFVPADRPARPAAPPPPRSPTARRAEVDRTLIPSCLVLGVTLPLLAGGWLLLDAESAVRASGPALPLGLLTAGLAFLTGAALLIRRVCRLRRCV